MVKRIYVVRSAAFILLQGVPTSVSLSEVRAALLGIPGVVSVHDLHVWQLSESEIVASVHVHANKSTRSIIQGMGSEAALVGTEIYEDDDVHMSLSAEVRKTLRHYGVKSSTVQLEYVSGSVRDSEVSEPRALL